MKQFVRPARVLPADPALALAALIAACTVAPEEARYPIKLNPRLGLASTDDATIDARLAGPLWPTLPDTDGLKLYKVAEWTRNDLFKPFEERVVDQQLATNCIELKKLVQADYYTLPGADYGLEFAILHRCETINVLRNAQPAHVSYVRGFVMSNEAVDVLPVALDNGGTPYWPCDAYNTGQNHVSWGEYHDIVDVEVRDDFELHVLSRHRAEIIEDDERWPLSGGFSTVRIIAWADFNGDDVEDIMIEVGSSAVTWWDEEEDYRVARESSYDRYILTRMSEDAVFRIIDAKHYFGLEEWGDEACETVEQDTVN